MIQAPRYLSMARFQILSLIGGGIRGAFVTSLLKEFEPKLGRPIAESFDLIAVHRPAELLQRVLRWGCQPNSCMIFMFATAKKSSVPVRRTRRKD